MSTPLTRHTRLTALIGAPAVVVALWLTGIEAWRGFSPRSPLFAAPFAYTLADAIATGNVQQAFQYIRAGEDPNQPVPVRHPDLTRNRWVFVLPIEWAAATGQTDAVRMLLGYGARPEPSALCVADALGHRDVVRVLRAYGGEAAATACDSHRMYPFSR